MIIPALAGAAVGAVAGVMLATDENRKTLRRVAKRLQHQGMERAETIAHELRSGSRRLSKVASQTKDKIRKEVKQK